MLISNTRERDALRPILQRMRVPHDSVLVVHSAIAALSHRGFRAEAMIETFLDYMRGGTVIMPTMTWHTVTPERPVWDELATPSHTGVLSEVFRTQYAAGRSIHPTHSVAGYGPQTGRLLERHHLDDTPVYANSPYGLMRDQAAYVLMLGVGLESCTAIHLAEETIAPGIYLRPVDQAEEYDCRDRYGVVHKVRTRRHLRLERDFPKFGPSLERRGRMRSGALEECLYAIVDLRDLLSAVFAALTIDPRGTLRERAAGLNK